MNIFSNVISSEVEKSHSYEVLSTTFGNVIVIVGHFIQQ